LRLRRSALESSSRFSQYRDLVVLKLDFYKGVKLECQGREFDKRTEQSEFIQFILRSALIQQMILET
jgi:hypothetical protein